GPPPNCARPLPYTYSKRCRAGKAIARSSRSGGGLSGESAEGRGGGGEAGGRVRARVPRDGGVAPDRRAPPALPQAGGRRRSLDPRGGNGDAALGLQLTR